MKQSEIKGLGATEVAEKLAEAQTAYADLRRTHIVSPLDNPAQIKTLRRTIARLNTALNNQ
jgi:large subunit ribosomal protein L29